MPNDGSRWDSLDRGQVKFDYENQTYYTVPEVSPKNDEGYLDSTANTSTAQTSGTSTSEAKAEKKKLKNDIYTLVGTANINPCSTVIPQLVTAKTVEITGVGNYLTGKYLIKSRTFSISSSGTSFEIEVIKTGFEGKSING